MRGNDETQGSGLAAQLVDSIRIFLESPVNSLGMEDEGERAWGEPLVGLAAGDDSVFQEFRRDIGPFYWTPRDAFACGHPDLAVSPAELTVVSWVLRQTVRTKHDNRLETVLPSERWVKAKYNGDSVNRQLHEFVVALFAEWGIAATAPTLCPEWRTAASERYGRASTWSERHAAYAAGLGTFGLCDGLITPVGKAMRCGSVIARVVLPTTPRPYEDHHAYCLHYAGRQCTSCIDRCPVGAIGETGHDKERCSAYLQEVLASHIEPVLGLHTSDRPFPIDACGLCQTKVPCESGIPSGLGGNRIQPNNTR